MRKIKTNTSLFNIETVFVHSGLRCTSCKSGKDRTSMSVTLEQCHVLREEYDLSDHEFESALEAMRRYPI